MVITPYSVRRSPACLRRRSAFVAARPGDAREMSHLLLRDSQARGDAGERQRAAVAFVPAELQQTVDDAVPERRRIALARRRERSSARFRRERAFVRVRPTSRTT